MISEFTAVEHMTSGMELLPSQIGRSNTASQEHWLWYSVLELAVGDYQTCRNPTTGRMWARLREVSEWFADTEVAPGSFEWCCEWFDINPDGLRKALRTGEAIKFLRSMRVASNRTVELAR